jgi:hypothetical protein
MPIFTCHPRGELPAVYEFDGCDGDVVLRRSAVRAKSWLNAKAFGPYSPFELPPDLGFSRHRCFPLPPLHEKQLVSLCRTVCLTVGLTVSVYKLQAGLVALRNTRIAVLDDGVLGWLYYT